MANMQNRGAEMLDLTTESTAVAYYTRIIAFRAAPERVYEALTTIDGIRRWWGTKATGSAESGGELRVEFGGYFLMRVDSATRPSAIRWSCIASTEQPDWEGTEIAFDLIANSLDSCELHFRHVGLTGELPCYNSCQAGSSYFLDSLVAYIESGVGTPLGGEG